MRKLSNGQSRAATLVTIMVLVLATGGAAAAGEPIGDPAALSVAADPSPVTSESADSGAVIGEALETEVPEDLSDPSSVPVESPGPDVPAVADPTEEPAPATSEDPAVEAPSEPGASASATVDPSISTDKENYGLRDVMTVKGAGWAAGEKVTLTLRSLDDSQTLAGPVVTANASGDFSEQIAIPGVYVVGLRLSATGESGRIVKELSALAGSQ